MASAVPKANTSHPTPSKAPPKSPNTSKNGGTLRFNFANNAKAAEVKPKTKGNHEPSPSKATISGKGKGASKGKDSRDNSPVKSFQTAAKSSNKGKGEQGRMAPEAKRKETPRN